MRRKSIEDLLALTEDAFRIAATHLSEGEIVSCIQKWIKDDKSGFLVEAVENQCTSLTDIGQALERYHQIGVQDEELSRSVQIGLRVSLARRFFTEDLEFINTAKNYIEIGDFYELVNHIISPPASHGKLGGKSAGHAARRADHPQVRRVLGPAGRHQGAEDLVHRLGRPP